MLGVDRPAAAWWRQVPWWGWCGVASNGLLLLLALLMIVVTGTVR